MEHDPAHQSRGRHLTRPRRPCRAGGEAGGERHVTPTQGGVLQKHRGGVTSPRPCSAVVVRGFRPRPDDTNRASGEGEDGSDPLFDRWRGSAMWGVLHQVFPVVLHPPHAFWGVAPVCMYPCGKAPRPARGPDDEGQRAARCVTHSSPRVSSSAASAPRAPGRGPTRGPTAIPWRRASAITRRTCTPPSSRGTTWRPAWPCVWPGTFSCARDGSGSPGSAAVLGGAPAARRDHFRPRPTGRPSASSTVWSSA